MTRVQTSIASLIISLVLFGAKLYAYFITHSSSVYSDAMESIVNIVGAGFLLFTILYSNKPADLEHPYGHGKMEFVSATLEGGLIGAAGVLILIEAIQALILGTPVHSLTTGVWVVLLTGLVNCGFGLFLKSQGKKLHSDAIQADGIHLLSDFYSTLAVVIGLVLVALTGWMLIDKILAIGIALFLGWTSFRIVSQAMGGLLDRQSKPLLQTLVGVFNESRTEPIIHIHHLRAMRAGSEIHIDAHVSLPEFWTLDQCHHALEDFENSLRKNIPQQVDFHFHMDPCFRGYCRTCSVNPCPIRKDPFKSRDPFDLPTLLLKDEEIEAYKKP